MDHSVPIIGPDSDDAILRLHSGPATATTIASGHRRHQPHMRRPGDDYVTDDEGND
jgi:hypothetical protein